MISLPPYVRIFIGTTPIDMRKSIDGLMTVVQEELREDAYSGHLFVFVSRRCDRVKILAWDKGGFVLFYKRLEEGRFKLPHMTPEAPAVNIDATQLAMLLEGIDWQQAKKSLHFARAVRIQERDGSRARTSS